MSPTWEHAYIHVNHHAHGHSAAPCTVAPADSLATPSPTTTTTLCSQIQACVDKYLRNLNWKSKTGCKAGLGAFPCPRGQGKVPGPHCKCKITTTTTLRAQHAEPKPVKTAALVQHPKPAIRPAPKQAAAPKPTAHAIQAANRPTPSARLLPQAVAAPAEKLEGPSAPSFVPGMEFAEPKAKNKRAKKAAAAAAQVAAVQALEDAQGSPGGNAQHSPGTSFAAPTYVRSLSSYNELLAAMGHASDSEDDFDDAPSESSPLAPCAGETQQPAALPLRAHNPAPAPAVPNTHAGMNAPVLSLHTGVESAVECQPSQACTLPADAESKDNDSGSLADELLTLCLG